MRITVRRRPSLRAAALLALLATGVVAPAPAQASCGSYVIVPGEQHATPNHPSPPPPQTRPVPCPQQRHDAPEPGRVPSCPGPTCSGAPAMPAPPVTSGNTGPQQRWDCLATPSVVAPPEGSVYADDESPVRPIRRSSSIFHPPRRAR